MVNVEVPSTELFGQVVLYLGASLEMAGHSVVTLREESVESLLTSPETDFLGTLEIYLGDGLEMAGYLVVTLGGDSINSYCCFMSWS